MWPITAHAAERAPVCRTFSIILVSTSSSPCDTFHFFTADYEYGTGMWCHVSSVVMLSLHASESVIPTQRFQGSLQIESATAYNPNFRPQRVQFGGANFGRSQRSHMRQYTTQIIVITQRIWHLAAG